MAVSMKYTAGHGQGHRCARSREHPPAWRVTLQVRIFSGQGPVTRRENYLSATVKGSDTKAWRRARDKLAELRTQVINQRAAATSVSLSHALDEWLRVTELEASTHKTYLGYIERTIKPAMGSVAVKKVDVHALESLYTELRRYRARCDGKPFVEHRVDRPHECRVVRHRYPPGRAPSRGHVDHDCTTAGCTVTVCQPQQRLGAIGSYFHEGLFVFSGSKTPDHSEPYSPNVITQRYKGMSARLGIETHLHALRHYSATELLTAGKAAEILGSRMPKRSGRTSDPG